MSEIRVVIADDHPLYRRGVFDSMEAEDDIEVVGEASTGEEAVRLVTEVCPDVIILDIDMPGAGGIKAAGEINARNPTTKILMLTVSESEDDLLAALKVGARGYLIKGVGAGGLARAVRATVAGEVYISPALAGSILFELTRDPEVEPMSQLTAREKDVLRLVGEGLTNREIGERLFLAEKTIKHYMTGVLQKLQVRSRVEAALLAQQQSWEN
jgi:DNA-binding NarL/FixJ family response regulator